MRIELLIFDWSGVISDDRRPVYEANMKILKQYGKPPMPFEEWLSKTTLSPVEFLRNCGIDETPEKLYSLYKTYYDEVIDSGMLPKIYPDVHDVFLFLKKRRKKLSVLSSHPADNLRKEVELYGLTKFLDLIVGSCRDKVRGLRSICKELKIKPEFALYIGDTVYDIRSAKKAGIRSAAVCTGYHSRERLEKENPDFLLGCLSDLKEIVS